MRSRGFGPDPNRGGSSGGPQQPGQQGMPSWLGPVLEFGGQTISALGNMGGGGDQDEQARRQRELERERILIQLMMQDARTRQRNTALEATTPIKQMLLNRVLGGQPGGLETANAMPRTYQSSVPGQASMTPPTQRPTGQNDFLGRPTQQTQYGQPADPQMLANLVPNFSQRRQEQFGQVQALTSQITADKFKGEEIIPKLSEFSQTRGAYTSDDQDPVKVSGNELLDLAASNPTAPVTGRFSNEKNDQLDDVEVGQLNDMIRNGATAAEVAAKYREFLHSRLDLDTPVRDLSDRRGF